MSNAQPRLTPWQRFRKELAAEKLSWRTVQDYGLILIGAPVQALAMRLFLVPAQLVRAPKEAHGKRLHQRANQDQAVLEPFARITFRQPALCETAARV